MEHEPEVEIGNVKTNLSGLLNLLCTDVIDKDEARQALGLSPSQGQRRPTREGIPLTDRQMDELDTAGPR